MATCRNQNGVLKIFIFYRITIRGCQLLFICICQQQMSRKRQQETFISNWSKRMRSQCCISTARNLL